MSQTVALAVIAIVMVVLLLLTWAADRLLSSVLTSVSEDGHDEQPPSAM